MPWDEARWDRGLRDHVRRWVALRHRYRSLRRGGYTRLYANKGVVAFGRRHHDETVVVAINAGDQPATVSLPTAGYLSDGTVLVDVEAENRLTVRKGRTPRLHLERLSGAVWEARPPEPAIR